MKRKRTIRTLVSLGALLGAGIAVAQAAPGARKKPVDPATATDGEQTDSSASTASASACASGTTASTSGACVQDSAADGAASTEASAAAQQSAALNTATETEEEPVCGDGFAEQEEACDAGALNGAQGAGCTADCTLPVCGDGHRAAGEYCDDGNTTDGDGCTADCKTEHEDKLTPYQSSWVYDVYDQSKGEGADSEYQLDTDYMVTSEHFTIRWSNEDLDYIREQGDDPEDYLSEAIVADALVELEKIWDTYMVTYRMEAPYADAEERFKTDVIIIEQGNYGAGHWGQPMMWIGYKNLKGASSLDHEFVHAWQLSTGGMQDNSYVGFFWETHARLMTFLYENYENGEDDTKGSERVAKYPHIHPGSTRLHYGTWPYLEFLRQEFSIDRVNEIWTEAPKDDDAVAQAETTPFNALQNNMGWELEVLNDFFGLYAMNNVNWDYDKREMFVEEFMEYDYRGDDSPNHLAQLAIVNGKDRQYVIPDFLAPQRWGYNISEIVPESDASSVTVSFKGIVQDDPNTTDFNWEYVNEPGIGTFQAGSYLDWEESVPNADSGWRWGVVAIQADGTSRKSALQAGAAASLNFPILADDQRIYLVVSAAPTTEQRLFWEQSYRSIYRYPWMVALEGAYAKGFEPGACDFPADVDGEAHPNGGGFVATTASVDESAYVGRCARVLDSATVTGNAKVLNRAVVSGDASVSGSAIVREDAVVMGSATVSGNALVEDMAILDDGSVTDDAAIGCVTHISNDETQLIDSASWYGAYAGSDVGVTLSGTVKLFGDAKPKTDLSQGIYSGPVEADNYFYPTLGYLRTEIPAEISWTLRPELGESYGWDGIIYADDADDDNDGVLDSDDAFPNDPSEWADIDGDGIGDNADTDDNGDGITDLDNDRDGLGNEVDDDDDNDTILDVYDFDVDGDSVPNWQDHFPNDATEVSDLDYDGIGDNADPDDDNDGVLDVDEACGEGPSSCVVAYSGSHFEELGYYQYSQTYFYGYWDDIDGKLFGGDWVVVNGEVRQVRRDLNQGDKTDANGNSVSWIGLSKFASDGSDGEFDDHVPLGSKWNVVEEPAETFCLFSSQEEICDGIDNDCDGEIDEGFVNTDGDDHGYTISTSVGSYENSIVWSGADCVDEDDDNDGVLDVVDVDPLDPEEDGYDTNGDGVGGDTVATTIAWDHETLIGIGDTVRVDMLREYENDQYDIFVHRVSDGALAFHERVSHQEELVADLEPGEYVYSVTSGFETHGTHKNTGIEFLWIFVAEQPLTVTAE